MMKAPLWFLGTSLLFATASAQRSTFLTYDNAYPVLDYWEQFQNPGEIIPGITISYLINATGVIWQQERVIDSVAYVCSDVLPYLRSIMPRAKWIDLFGDPICKQVSNAVDDLESFDAERSCNKLTSLITYLAFNNRFRRQVEILPEDHFDIFEILTDIIRDLYDIDVDDQSTLCPNVQQFLEPSLPDVITRFTVELVSALLPQAVRYICQDWPDWEDYFSSVGFDTPSPFYHIINDAADIGSRMLGYENKGDICTAMIQALDKGGEERRVFGRNALESVLNIFIDVDRCMMTGNDAISDIIDPYFMILSNAYPEFEVGSSLIQEYTGFEGVQEICTAVKTAFIPTRSLSIGAIIGIAVGVIVAVVLLLAITIFIVYRRIHQGSQKA